MNAPTRRLAAVWFADVAGFTKLSATDEPLALLVMDAMRDSVRAAVTAQHGTLIKFLGDGALAEFPSAEGAVEAALEASARFKGGTRPLDGGPYKLHIGIHVGDVAVASDGDIFGDGVNRAARLQSLAEAGQILVSADVYRSVRRGLEFQFTSLGEKTAKGLEEPFEVFAVEARGSILGRLSLIEREARPQEQQAVVAQGKSMRRRAIGTGIAAAVVAFLGLGIWTAMGGTVGATPEGELADSAAAPAVVQQVATAPTGAATPAPVPAGPAQTTVSAQTTAAGTDATTPAPTGAAATDAAPSAPTTLAGRGNALIRNLRNRDLSANETLPLLRAAVDALETGTTAPAQAHAARGVLQFVVARNPEQAEASFRLAIEADPASGPVRRMYAQMLTARGRYEEALFHVEQGKPNMAPGAYDAALGSIYFRNGDEDADNALDRALKRNEDALAVRILLARAKIKQGDEDDAIEILNGAAGSMDVQPWVAYAQVHEKQGNLSDTERSRFADQAARPEAGMAGALIYLELGQVDQALAVIDRLLAARDPDLLWLSVDPEWAAIKDNPQFMRRVVRVFEN